MEWSEVIASPYLKDLPFKIELNKYGTILMSPASNNHGIIQASLSAYFARYLKGGTVVSECSVQTSDGVKVPDVVWASHAFMKRHGKVTPFPEAPEICVEVVSPSNSEEDMAHKVELYLARGAKEVWLVDEEKRIRYFAHPGEIKKSVFLPKVKLV